MDILTEKFSDDMARDLRYQPLSPHISSLKARYKNAYLVATMTHSLERPVKGLGVLVGITLAISGIQLAGGSGPPLAGLALIAIGLALSGLFYVVGIFVASLGHILKATIDCAVNTSPFLDNENRVQIMALR